MGACQANGLASFPIFMRSMHRNDAIMHIVILAVKHSLLSHQKRRFKLADRGCGRSPTGKCVVWHALTEKQYQVKKAGYNAKQSEKTKADWPYVGACNASLAKTVMLTVE